MTMRLWFLPCMLLVSVSTLRAQSLHERIDQMIESTPGFGNIAAPMSSDAEFLRRVYLDLTGSIPPFEVAQQFLADKSPNKRQTLIDRLLRSPEYARRMQQFFDVMLMERRPTKRVPEADFQEYLRQSFADNKPWDQLVREILSADGDDPKLRPASRFMLDRDAEPNQLTRDISRLFLGMNLHCAQCHDHPVVRSYKQEDYYGIYAFLSRTFIFTDKKRKNLAVLAEKAEGDVTFVSVFDPTKTQKTTMPRMPGLPPIKVPNFKKGEEYQVKPAKGVRPVPKFSWRAQLAKEITSPENVRFRRNIANRLWQMMMGRGLVDPVDFDHPDNPPSHPDLLALLADEFASHRYDIRWFVRELALTRTYQRSSMLSAGATEVPPDRFAVANLKPLSPEQLAQSMMEATGSTANIRRALGSKLTEQALYARLKPAIAQFVRTFGAQPGEPEGDDFEVTIDQTLFITNGPLIRSWLKPSGENLLARLEKVEDAKQIAAILFLSIFTRQPSDEETKDVADYLRGRTDRTQALQEIAWALLASNEFRFNH
ncbi:MAG: hypothetical protein KatS3mg105_3849 [Gemmatales bacterium]|nr:MAG: hypothetical protein KatS3mg105_3849 [Gemmatales bacterium]